RGAQRPVRSEVHSTGGARRQPCPRNLSRVLPDLQLCSFSFQRVLRSFFLEDEIVLNRPLERINLKCRSLSLVGQLQFALALILHEYLESTVGVGFSVVLIGTTRDLDL